ncbi:MAG TPA: hypothetical protein VMU03_10970, partial [Gammaproteobacteria bacterium]|nr:hypothetical protein [Gammaproteobacteria bacterium]
MSHVADRVPLSVGVLLDRARQERWVLGALRRVVALSCVRLAAVAIANGATRASSPAGALHVAVDSVDRALRCRGEPRFARVDVVAELAPPRSIVVSALRSADGWTVTTGDAAFLAGCGVDVWLCFTALRPCRPFPRVSRFGVWGLEIGVDTPAVDRWAGASEVATASPLTETALVDYRESTRTAISRTIGATIGNSARSNRLSSVCKALPICARALRALSRSGAVASALSGSATASRPGLPTPTSGAVLSLAGRIVGAVAANRWRALRWRDQWQIGYCFPDRDDRRLLASERLRYLVPPPDRFWADPFALEHDGRYFIFFEELVFRTGLGRITAIEV